MESLLQDIELIPRGKSVPETVLSHLPVRGVPLQHSHSYQPGMQSIASRGKKETSHLAPDKTKPSPSPAGKMQSTGTQNAILLKGRKIHLPGSSKILGGKLTWPHNTSHVRKVAKDAARKMSASDASRIPGHSGVATLYKSQVPPCGILTPPWSSTPRLLPLLDPGFKPEPSGDPAKALGGTDHSKPLQQRGDVGGMWSCQGPKTAPQLAECAPTHGPAPPFNPLGPQLAPK
ncbi:hypothetical protein GWK47_032292 [Chionoecetes opilio]|uniref:Uncharacterized protein n=1 Tax=Chionoecetes opilio TaxID=41210 RepID=A0A8J4YIW5_CHIOP|nr:hypothetical protein GWK47_032292 [Chionoecetes opilio]